MTMTLRRFDLPMKRPFTISRGTTVTQPLLVVTLQQEGVCGYGEAPECAYYGATIDNITTAVERVRPQIESAVLGDPVALWDALRPQLAAFPFAQSAIDMAAHDLWGKLHHAPVWKLWGLTLRSDLPPTDITFGIDPIDVMVAKINDFPDWPIYKVKLGTPHDLAIIRALRRHTNAVLRVDANAAWGVEETISNAAALRALGVEFIEQPLAPNDWEGMRRVHRESVLPIVADESCRTEADLDRCAQCFDGVNIKLVKCGGLVPARRMIARARQLGLRVMVGCFTESTISISAIAQLLPLLDYADMDGALLLAEDIAAGVRVERGRLVFSQDSGLGVRLLKRDKESCAPRL